MPVLTATITALGLYGGPAPANESYAGKVAEPPASTRTYSEDFTGLALYGGSGDPRGDFTGKTALAFYEKAASDTVRAIVTEGSIGDVDVDVTDAVLVVVSDAAAVRNYKASSDTVRPVVTDATQALLKSGTGLYSRSDTATPVVTETASIRVLVSVSDTVTAVVTDAKDSLGKANERTGTDTATVVVTETSTVLAINASDVKASTDTAQIVVTDVATVTRAGEVDYIDIHSLAGSIEIRPT